MQIVIKHFTNKQCLNDRILGLFTQTTKRLLPVTDLQPTPHE